MPEQQDILSIGFDYKQTEADAAKVLASMKEVLATAENLNSVKFSLGSGEGFAASKKSAEELNKTLRENQKITDDYNKSLITSAKQRAADARATQEQEKANQQALRTQKLKNAESDKTASSIAKEQKAIDNLGNDYKQLSIALKDAEARYAALYLQGKGGSQAAKDALSTAKGYREQLNEVDQALGNYQRNVGNYSSAFTGYANTLRGLRGPTKLLGEALGIGAMEADQFRLIIEHAFQGVAAFFRGKEAKTASEVKDTIATATNTTAQAANTTVTEAGAVAQTEFAAATTTASGAMTVFRGIMLATGIGVAVGLIALAVIRIIEFKKALAESRLAQEDLNEGLKSDTYKTAIENFEKLKINVGLAKDGLLDKKEVLKQYNDTLGVTTGKVTSLDEAESALVNKGRAYIQMMLLQAAANIALEKAAEKAVAAEEERQKNRLEFAKTFADARIATPGAFNAQEYDADTKRIAAAQEKRKQEAVKKEQDAAQKQLDIAESFQKQAAEIAKKNNFDFFSGKEDAKVKNVKTIADAVAELRKELAAIQGKQDLGELAPTEADIDRVKAFDKAFEDIFKRGGKTTTPIVQQLAIELDPIEARVLEAKIHELVTKINGKEKIDLEVKESEEIKKWLKSGEDAVKKFRDMQKAVSTSFRSFAEDEGKFYDEISQRQLTAITTETEREQIELTKRFAAGKITTEEYQKELADIQTRYAQKSFAEQLKWLQREIDILPAGTKSYEDAQKKKADIELQFLKQIQDTEAQSIEKRKQGYKDLANAVVDLYGFIIENGYDEEKKALEDNQKTRDENFQLELKNIQNSNLSLQEKADKTTALQAQEDAAKKLSDDRQTELDRKRAKIERLVQVAEITGTATQTVFKLASEAAIAKGQAAVLASNPLTAAYAPTALASAAAIAALIPITIALAGAQIAKLVIPKFADGVMNKQDDGFGIYGEAGLEMVKKPGQAPFFANKATFDFLPKGTDIIPIGSDDINKIMYASMFSGTARATGGKSDKVESILLDIRNDLKKSRKASQRVDLTLKHNSGWEIYKQKYYS